MKRRGDIHGQRVAQPRHSCDTELQGAGDLKLRPTF